MRHMSNEAKERQTLPHGGRTHRKVPCLRSMNATVIQKLDKILLQKNVSCITTLTAAALKTHPVMPYVNLTMQHQAVVDMRTRRLFSGGRR